jgi:hypothetical protein
MVRKLIKCPECGANNDDNYNFCKSCGKKLVKYNFCQECGHKNVDTARFCENCGMNLKTFESGSVKTQNGVNDSNEIVPLDLTPAESLMILDHKTHQRTPKELFKATLIDLIFKNVFQLDVQEVEKKGILGSKIVKKTYLLEGKNFNMPLKPHEEVFRKHLPRKADSKRLKKLQQQVYKTYHNNYAQKKLLEPLSLEGFFEVEKKFLGKKYFLSNKGVETQQMIMELKDEGRNLENWVENDPERAKSYLLMGGSNIFLTDVYYFNWFKNNSKKISALFAGAAAVGTAYAFNKIRWYGAFRKSYSHDMDFGDFDDFNSFDSFSDIFSDFDTFDIFDSMDFSDFDSGFDGGFDGGGDCGGGGD